MTNKIKQSTLLILLASFSLGFVRCKKDSSEVPAGTDSTSLAAHHSGAVNLATTTTTTSTTGAYDITKSLPTGYVKDGSVDYTAYLQKAINANSNIVFPAFPIMVDDAGLIVGSNKTITFLTGSKLVLKPSANANYNIINVLLANNVTLNNPVIVGDRYKHLGTTGNWGQGISINGSTNVTINNPNVSNCWGDGMFIAQKSGITAQNIKIVNAYLTHNRRNGISLTGGINVDLESPYCAYSDGVAPYCGIDIEPNVSTDQLQNIVLNNPKTEHNVGPGISTGLKRMYSSTNKTIGITIANHSDLGSAIAFHSTVSLTYQIGSATVSGNINLVNPSWKRNTNTAITTDLLANTIKLNISKPTVQDINGVTLTQAQIISLFTYKTHINREANYSLTF
jgi:hypothetical protein